MSRIRTQLHSPVLCVVDKVTLFQTRLKENTENIVQRISIVKTWQNKNKLLTEFM